MSRLVQDEGKIILLVLSKPSNQAIHVRANLTCVLAYLTGTSYQFFVRTSHLAVAWIDTHLRLGVLLVPEGRL